MVPSVCGVTGRKGSCCLRGCAGKGLLLKRFLSNNRVIEMSLTVTCLTVAFSLLTVCDPSPTSNVPSPKRRPCFHQQPLPVPFPSPWKPSLGTILRLTSRGHWGHLYGDISAHHEGRRLAGRPTVFTHHVGVPLRKAPSQLGGRRDQACGPPGHCHTCAQVRSDSHSCPAQW